MSFVMHPNCDASVTFTGLSAGGGYLNAATVTYALKTAAGVTITGGTGSMTYTAASSGVYTATVESTVTTLLTAGVAYLFEVTVVSGSYNDFRRVVFYPTVRGET